jgi:lipid-binding SYLF domain-containing protein
VHKETFMKRLAASLMICCLVVVTAWAANKEAERVETAGQVMQEILGIPEGIPQSILDKADCVIVMPSVVKFAIGFGGSYGRGVMTCRSNNFAGPWSAPAMMALEGGSFGLQLGGQATDFVLLVMNEKGAHGILTGKVKLGADLAAAAGPKGRDAAAATDVTMRAEILSYSRSRGLFAGISLEGSTLRADNGAIKSLYGKEIPAEGIVLRGAVPPPPSAKVLLDTLNSKSPRHTR